MKIVMLETVEDSHAYVDKENGKPVIRYDVRKFYAGKDYENVGPDWDNRADGFVKLGKAKEVTE